MIAASADTLVRLLRGEWIDPDGGEPIHVPIQVIAIERTLAGHEADLVASLNLGRSLAVVSDETTRVVLGERVKRALRGRADVHPVVLDGVPHADAATVDFVRRATAHADALIAVGAGTINDLCKYAAAKDAKRYAVFATAPSMNGYASMNAAITVDGHKRSLGAITPAGIFVDLEVMSSAPKRMIRAGLADSICRSTAQADWLLSHHALGTRYRRAPFDLLADDEPALLDEPEALLAGDIDAMLALARTLILSGLGMTICGGSYPASQGEHLISHYIDMFAPPTRGAYFHGEQVGVATLTMARIQQDVLSADSPRLASAPIDCATLQRRFGDDMGASCWREFATKPRGRDADAKLEAHLGEHWTAIRESVGRAMIAPQRIAAALQRAGCPTDPSRIGVSRELYGAAVRNARVLRDRYTFLDLAAASGHPALADAR